LTCVGSNVQRHVDTELLKQFHTTKTFGCARIVLAHQDAKALKKVLRNSLETGHRRNISAILAIIYAMSAQGMVFLESIKKINIVF
jgi:hypothetical protein